MSFDASSIIIEIEIVRESFNNSQASLDEDRTWTTVIKLHGWKQTENFISAVSLYAFMLATSYACPCTLHMIPELFHKCSIFVIF